ncbi:MAG: hypothetical protein JSU74_06080 [Candidatus Zixiibacteriota bacterium]|nr:MAG: hypothetical protein JSU74_06080 [candidate division Zixibacteria bacterium]
MGKIFPIIAIVITALLPLSMAHSQPKPQSEAEELSAREMVEALSKTNLRAVEDYEDFIERLERLAYDYQNYLSDIEDYHATKYQAHLQKLILKINEGAYCSNITELAEDIELLSERLQGLEHEIEHDHRKRELHDLSKNLHRDLEILGHELEDEILERIVQATSREAIVAYLEKERESLKKARKIYLKTLTEHEELIKEISQKLAELEIQRELLTEEQQEALLQLEELSLEIEDWDLVELESLGVVVVVPPVPPTPELQELPPLPPKKVVTGPQGRLYVHRDGPYYTKVYSDSIDVPSRDLSIFINNETGDLKVQGWDEDRVVVSFRVEVAAQNEKSGRDFTDNIETRLFANKDGIYLKTNFPSLSDPKRKIVMSRVEVMVPANNSLICENSFGLLNVSNLLRGLKLNASHCDVFLDEIHGGIEAVNKMNPMEITDCSGTVSLMNSLGPIVVAGCHGEFDIENSYAAVELSDNNGEVVIRNSGLVHIRDHVGAVTIENENGIVQVTDLTGNVNARNSFRPVYVSDIEGSVDLANINASIEMSFISGAATVVNNFGSISGRYIAGPLQLSSENGSVVMELPEFLAGPSSIVVNHGKVNVLLNDNSDVLLTASTRNGNIEGIPAKVYFSEGNVKSTTISYGQATNALDVTGENALIVIGDAGDI